MKRTVGRLFFCVEAVAFTENASSATTTPTGAVTRTKTFVLTKPCLKKLREFSVTLRSLTQARFLSLTKNTWFYQTGVQRKKDKYHSFWGTLSLSEQNQSAQKRFCGFWFENEARSWNLWLRFQRKCSEKGIKESSPAVIAENFDEANFLFGIKGQTAETMQKDIELGLKYFERICVNIMCDNTTEVEPDKAVIKEFMQKVYPVYKDNPRTDILINNTDFGVGDWYDKWTFAYILGGIHIRYGSFRLCSFRQSGTLLHFSRCDNSCKHWGFNPCKRFFNGTDSRKCAFCGNIFDYGHSLGMWGQKAANKAVLTGILSSVFFLVLSQSWMLYNPSPNDTIMPSIKAVFSNTPRMIFASLIVYAISQLFDVWLYHKWWKFTEKKFGDKRRFYGWETTVQRLSVKFLTQPFSPLLRSGELMISEHSFQSSFQAM